MAVELKTEVEIINMVVSRLDRSIEKISEFAGDVGKLLAVHDERIGQLEKVSEKRTDDIKEIHSRISGQSRDILEKIENMENNLKTNIIHTGETATKQHKENQEKLEKELKLVETRIAKLEHWKWFVIGAATFVGFMLKYVIDLKL